MWGSINSYSDMRRKLEYANEFISTDKRPSASSDSVSVFTALLCFRESFSLQEYGLFLPALLQIDEEEQE